MKKKTKNALDAAHHWPFVALLEFTIAVVWEVGVLFQHAADGVDSDIHH